MQNTFFFKYGFHDGFTIAAISYQMVMAAVIFCIVATPLILEKSYISTKNGMYILGAFVIGTILGTLSENYGGNWGGRVFFIWIFISMIFVILNIIIPEIIKEKASIGKNQIKGYYPTSEKSHVDQQPYILSDPTQPLQINVENAIRRFNPSRRYEYEIDYQKELYIWLRREFPVEYEVQTGSSRPDLIVKNIAIEIKGPTRNRELDTLTTKFLKYANHYQYFIIVLFDCNFSEGHFNEIYSGIKQFAPHVKIIRK